MPSKGIVIQASVCEQHLGLSLRASHMQEAATQLMAVATPPTEVAAPDMPVPAHPTTAILGEAIEQSSALL